MNEDRTCETFYSGKELKEEFLVALSKKWLGKEANTSGLKEFLKETLASIVYHSQL